MGSRHLAVARATSSAPCRVPRWSANASCRMVLGACRETETARPLLPLASTSTRSRIVAGTGGSADMISREGAARWWIVEKFCSTRVVRAHLERRRAGLFFSTHLPIMTRGSTSVFRPCIDLHQGVVKQIVGGSLRDDDSLRQRIDDAVTSASASSSLQTNFTSDLGPAHYAELYRNSELHGAHVIKLGPGNDDAAQAAIQAWPHALQLGGGITVDNAKHWIDSGAHKVCVLRIWLYPSEEYHPSTVLLSPPEYGHSTFHFLSSNLAIFFSILSFRTRHSLFHFPNSEHGHSRFHPPHSKHGHSISLYLALIITTP